MIRRLPFNTDRPLRDDRPMGTVRAQTSGLGMRVCAAIVWLGLAGGCAPEPPPQQAEPRHLVLISVDTLGAKHVGAYGYERDTSPEIDALASRGTLFENAYTQQVWTLTAHLSLMTGMYPQAHGASEHRAAWPAAPTLAATLAPAGFKTAAFTGIGAYMNPRFGLGRGFDRYVIGGTHAARDDERRLAWLRAQAAKAAADPDHRFFLFSHYFDVHSDVGTDVPYVAPEEDTQRYLAEVLPAGESWPRRGDTDLLIELEKSGEATPRDRQVIEALYDAGVRYTDREAVGRLLSELEVLGLNESTLVVLTSDHGEEILEHGKVSHQQPFEETARVPLVFAGPGVPVAARFEDLVELVDVMPTVLGLLGVPSPAGLQGRDLSPIWRGEALPAGVAHVDGLFGGLPNMKWRYPSARTEVIDGTRYSYVGTVHDEIGEGGKRRFFMYREGALYDLGHDPAQRSDLAKSRPAIARAMRVGLLAWYDENERVARQLEASGGAAGVPAPSPEEAERLRALGYAE